MKYDRQQEHKSSDRRHLSSLHFSCIAEQTVTVLTMVLGDLYFLSDVTVMHLLLVVSVPTLTDILIVR